MPGPSLQTDAFVLLKQPPTDSFQHCTVFSPEHGLLLALQRVPKKPSASTPTPLDLFDEASLILESSNQGRTWFVKEARLITRFAGIGRNYATLLQASAFASLIARNHVAEESRAPIGALLAQVFAAFATNVRPDIAHFKALYCFARDEGYPLKEHWLASLTPADRTTVAGLLNRPLAEQVDDTNVVHALHVCLENYLRGHTEILLD